MNPQHAVPVLVDGDHVVSESKAIVLYLADKYASDKPDFYPQNEKIRASVCSIAL